MPRINVNLGRETHERLKIYATKKNINLDEATEELLSMVLGKSKGKDDENNIHNIRNKINRP